MIRGVYLNGSMDDWCPCLDIRKKVFCDEFGLNIDVDEQDAMAIQVLLYDHENVPVASARLMFDLSGVFQFDYLAVLPEKRKQGYADFIMHMIFDKAFQCGATYLASSDIRHCPEYFSKYGFEIEGDRMILDLKKYFNTHKCCH